VNFVFVDQATHFSTPLFDILMEN